jgi:hypothetical protein
MKKLAVYNIYLKMKIGFFCKERRQLTTFSDILGVFFCATRNSKTKEPLCLRVSKQQKNSLISIEE